MTAPVRIGLAAVVVVVMGLAITGIGMGGPPPYASAHGHEEGTAPGRAEVAAARRRIAAGGEQVRQGEEEFAEEHCGACHALAATGDDGELGPRMDTQDDPVDEIAENISDPGEHVVRGYSGRLMPDYGDAMDEDEIKAVSAFIHAASGGGGAEGGEGGEDHD